jgi:ribosomal protein S18 acetylase RimI-like enzyme
MMARRTAPRPADRSNDRQPDHRLGYAAVMTAAETPFLIRPVRPEEYEALGDLTVAAYHAIPSAEMLHEDAYDSQLRDVARRAATSCVMAAATPAGELLGGVTYVSGPDDPYSEDLREGEAGIRMLAVDPGAQRRGIGRALTQWCLDRARSDGRRRLVLHTSYAMPAAVRLYERMGFLRAPELDFAPVPGVDLIAFAFELGPAAR